MTEHQSVLARACLFPTASGGVVETEGSEEESDFPRTEFVEPKRKIVSRLGPPAPHTRSDEELLAAAQGGISSALEELLTRHRMTVYRAARRFVESADDADDLVQETMLRAFVSIGNFRSEARFSSWLVAIVINAALSSKRKSSHFHWIYLDEIQESEDRSRAWILPDSRPNPEQEYLRRELRILLRREVSRQHRKYRFILQACDVDEFSIEEVAQVLGITHAAVKSRLHRARRKLSGALRRYGAPHTPLDTGRVGL
jgi:RNA polymerase sigma-70 factor (ECF subfamily)